MGPRVVVECALLCACTHRRRTFKISRVLWRRWRRADVIKYVIIIIIIIIVILCAPRDYDMFIISFRAAQSTLGMEFYMDEF